MSPVTYPPLVTKDVGLGSAYERVFIYRLIARWIEKYPVQTAMEGVLDGMAGLPGIHLIPAAYAGAKVTVICPDETIAGAVHGVYDFLGLVPRLRIIIGSEWPAGETAELVMIFNALAFAPDWRSFLRETASHASRRMIISTTNAACYGAQVSRMLRAVGLRRRETELFDHPSAHRSTLEAEIAPIGTIRERSCVDAPWWPDLFVKPGNSLISGFLKDLPGKAARADAAPSERSLKHSYGPGNFPYFQRTPAEKTIIQGILRQPNADTGVFRPLAPLLAHHRMSLVEVGPVRVN